MKHVLLLFLIMTGMSAFSQFNPGLKVPSAEQASKTATVRPRAVIVALRPAIDLSVLLPVPGMQGYTQGSCTAWSLTYGMMTYINARQRRWNLRLPTGQWNTARIFSPAFLYNQINNDPDCREGVYLHEALEFCVSKGGLPLSSFRYNPSSCSTKANNGQWQAALNNRLLSFNKLFSAFEQPLGREVDIFTIKARLNDSIVVPIGVHLDNSFMNNSYGNRAPNAPRPYIWDQFGNDIPIESAYHAMLCVGYNDTLNAFKVLNSWDVSFGDQGYVWIAENVFKTVVKEAFIATPRPLGATLVAPRTREMVNVQETENILKDLITDTNWIKKGYYREYDDLRVGCLDLDNARRTAIVRLTNIEDSTVITTQSLKVGDEYQVFEYKGREISIRILRIGNAGTNPFTRAIFYDLRYRNIDGNGFN